MVFASLAGAPNNPPWYYNLLANPEVGVEVGQDQYQAIARVVEEPERSRLYEEMIKLVHARGDLPGKVWFFYTTCPKCAKAYGKNFVVGVAELL